MLDEGTTTRSALQIADDAAAIGAPNAANSSATGLPSASAIAGTTRSAWRTGCGVATLKGPRAPSWPARIRTASSFSEPDWIGARRRISAPRAHSSLAIWLSISRSSRAAGATRAPIAVIVPPGAAQDDSERLTLSWVGEHTLEARFPLQHTGVYVGAVLLLSRLLAPVTPGGDLAVAAATLAAAAVFAPARRRIQTAVDRRFNRARCDARRELDAFRARLRGAVDLDDTGGELVVAAARTVQPAAVSLWLRAGGGT